MIGPMIKKYLISKGISQAFISDKTGIPSNTLSNIMNGKRNLLAEEYYAICQAIEVPLDTFLKNKVGQA